MRVDKVYSHSYYLYAAINFQLKYSIKLINIKFLFSSAGDKIKIDQQVVDDGGLQLHRHENNQVSHKIPYIFSQSHWNFIKLVTIHWAVTREIARSKCLIKWATLSWSNDMGGLILMMLLYRPSVLTMIWFLYISFLTDTAVFSSGSLESRHFTNSIPKNSPTPLRKTISFHWQCHYWLWLLEDVKLRWYWVFTLDIITISIFDQELLKLPDSAKQADF